MPVPVNDPDGEPVTVHVPDAGNPLKATLPVATLHVGCVVVPIVGVLGAALTTTSTTLEVVLQVLELTIQ